MVELLTLHPLTSAGGRLSSVPPVQLALVVFVVFVIVASHIISPMEVIPIITTSLASRPSTRISLGQVCGNGAFTVPIKSVPDIGAG